jgi:hypothetical protein
MKKSLLTPMIGISASNLAALRSASSCGDPLALSRGLDRLTVLVGAGEEEDLLAALAHVASEHVGRHRRVRVPEVRLGVDVVDRRGDVEVFLAHDAADATDQMNRPGFSGAQSGRNGGQALARHRIEIWQ